MEASPGLDEGGRTQAPGTDTGSGEHVLPCPFTRPATTKPRVLLFEHPLLWERVRKLAAQRPQNPPHARRERNHRHAIDRPEHPVHRTR